MELPPPSAVDREWLLSYPPGVPDSYEYPQVPLTRFLDDAAKDFPEGCAVEFGGARLSYRVLAEHVDRLATALAGLGVAHGDRVALALPSCPQHVVAVFAVLRLGAVAVEIEPGCGPGELGRRLHETESVVVVCLDSDYRALAQLKGQLPHLGHVIATTCQEYRRAGPRLAARLARWRRRIPAGEGVLAFGSLIANSSPATAQARVQPSTDLAALIYTDTPADRPRAAMLTHANLVANAFQVRLWLPDMQAGQERLLCRVPMTEAYGLTVGLGVSTLSAATIRLLPHGGRRGLARAAARAKPTVLAGYASDFEALATPGGDQVRSLRIGLCAGQLPPATVRTVEQRCGAQLCEGFGLAEAGATHINPVYGKRETGGVGLPLPDTVCTLGDPDDPNRAAPPGEPGELLVHGPQVTAGYWREPQASTDVFRNGWLATGRLATVNHEGYSTLSGSVDEVGRVGDDETAEHRNSDSEPPLAQDTRG
jgi:long-chain acyl-CoA synthetase